MLIDTFVIITKRKESWIARTTKIEKREVNNNHKYHFILISFYFSFFFFVSFMNENDCAHTVCSYAIDGKWHRVRTAPQNRLQLDDSWWFLLIIKFIVFYNCNEICCFFFLIFVFSFVEWRITIINPSSLLLLPIGRPLNILVIKLLKREDLIN